ncbi:hypothetical protein [Microcoleus sp. D3_18a_C4]|uniref:hypothetical protein n=1 Tax=Microcoleus sp. D3_18a_C4 TaxID=3055332 RepID=UPI002FD54169
MANNLISTSISTKELTFKPGGLPAVFEVNAINDSDRFASFQLEVQAAGADAKLNQNWYFLNSEVSTKKPPGDCTQFIVKIIDTPLPGFVGQVNLTVRVFSIELQDEIRQVLRLTVQEGTSGVALSLTLPVPEFQVYPQQLLKIPVQIYNPSYQPANAVLQLSGIDSTWLIEDKQVVHVAPRDRVEAVFLCQIPETTQAASQLYPFTIEATLTNGLSSKVAGSLLVLPQGSLLFRCSPQQHRVPSRRRDFWRSDPITYQLNFENLSNIKQICHVDVESEETIEYSLIPEQVELPIGDTNQMLLVAKVKRHWFGRVKNLLIEVVAELSDQRLGGTSPQSETLQLKVLPLIPSWLLMGSGLLLLWLGWYFSWLNPDNPSFGHEKAVNSVQFNGLASTLVTGSTDETTALWWVAGFFDPLTNQFLSEIGNAHKAVRVVRYRPIDNNIIAAGLENGEIQLWELTGGSGLIDAFYYQKDDRVLALEFAPDSRSLFSGHGSGLVIQWDTTLRREAMFKKSNRLMNKKQFDFAVYALKLIGDNNNNLVVAGRYNQLVLWDLSTDRTFKVPYPLGSQDDYILTVDTAELAPHILATADNKGNIMLWDMRSCLEGKGPCQMLDRWFHSKEGEAVRSISLSENACYLASGGDDGKVTLWALTSEGKRARELRNGEVVQKKVTHSYNNKKINSVHLKLVDGQVLIASGSDDTQVRVGKDKRREDLGCDSRRNIERSP